MKVTITRKLTPMGLICDDVTDQKADDLINCIPARIFDVGQQATANIEKTNHDRDGGWIKTKGEVHGGWNLFRVFGKAVWLPKKWGCFLKITIV